MAELKKLGRYELRSVLGKGAMGVVYEGYDPTLSRRVAVKTILKSVAFDDETERNYAERFVREAKAVARLNHANIVQVHDFGVENEVAYLVMEFIQGRELRSYFVAGERFETAECVRIMGELLDALDFAHEAGVIHRDVKPANVMLDAQRRVKLADFGVARVQDSERSAAGTMVGTPAFMSPEQISGKKIDRRTDIFSAGTILYQLLTGEQPFKGDGAWTVAKQIMQDEPPRPSSISLNLTPAFDEVVNKALAKSPGDRFASAKQFSAALRAALAPGSHAAAVGERRQQPRSEIKASETELEFWRSIQNRDDLDELELYVEHFPNGAYTQLARLKIAKLKEPAEAARKAAEERARQEAEAQEKARQEAAAQEQARREAEERARQEAEARAKRESEERARRESLEKAQREAAAKAKRDAEEKARQAQALDRLRRQEKAAARATPPVDDDATVAVAGTRPAAPPGERKTSYAVPAVVAAILIAAGVGAYIYLGRKPALAPVPVAEAPVAPKAAVPAPAAAPPKAEVSAAEIERIRKEAEERVRREYADKSAAEQAAAAKAAAAKAVHEKQLALKAAMEKAAAERAAAERAARVAAERAAEEKAAAAGVAQVRAAAAKAAEERAAAARAAEEKAAAARSAEKAAEAAKAAPPPASVAAPAPARAALPGRYAFRISAGSGVHLMCDRGGFEEEIVIPAGGAQGISGRQFSNLFLQAGQDGSISGRMFDGSNRLGSGESKLDGRADATGYAGSYVARYSGNAAGCTGRWSLVRKVN